MSDPDRFALDRLRAQDDLIAKMRVVIEAVRAIGSRGHWDAPHWNLIVPAREANALFDLAYELDPQLAALAVVHAPQLAQENK